MLLVQGKLVRALLEQYEHLALAQSRSPHLHYLLLHPHPKSHHHHNLQNQPATEAIISTITKYKVVQI